MAQIDRYDAKIRVFRWDVKLRETSPSCDGLFLITVTSFFPTLLAPFGETFCVRNVGIVPYSMHNLRYLLNFDDTKELLRETFERFPLLRSCKNVNLLIHQLAADLGCKFRFSPEFLMNTENSKLVISFDLKITAPKSDYTLRSVCNNDENLVKDLEAAASLDGPVIKLEQIEEIEDYLKRRLGSNAVEPRGLDEVKGALEVKVFREDNNGNNGNIAGDHSLEKLCPICLERLSEGAIVAETSCSHIFHKSCVTTWLLKTNSCPICRSSFGISV